MNKSDIVAKIETFLGDYATLAHERYLLPLALWVIGTFMFTEFDAYPYLVITSDTKRSGKTRLAELLSFCCSNPRNFGAMTPAGIFRSIATEKPTLFIDEAETISGESQTIIGQVLNMGYRKGQKVPRVIGSKVEEFETYCPKAFVLIGDVRDTLRDRSIPVRMKRAEPRLRFTYEAVKDRGAELREEIAAAVKNLSVAMVSTFEQHRGLDFLTDRDEEIWTPLFVIAEHFCPERIPALQMSAVDIATEKTADKRRYVNLMKFEEEATEDEYAQRLLMDLHDVLKTHDGHLPSERAIEALRAIPLAPWRTFRGNGITKTDIANMLARYPGCKPKNIRDGRGRSSKVVRGYKLADIQKAVNGLGVKP